LKNTSSFIFPFSNLPRSLSVLLFLNLFSLQNFIFGLFLRLHNLFYNFSLYFFILFFRYLLLWFYFNLGFWWQWFSIFVTFDFKFCQNFLFFLLWFDLNFRYFLWKIRKLILSLLWILLSSGFFPPSFLSKVFKHFFELFSILYLVCPGVFLYFKPLITKRWMDLLFYWSFFAFIFPLGFIIFMGIRRCSLTIFSIY